MAIDPAIVVLRFVGVCLCVFLIYRAARPASRPFALPTLVAALLLAWFFTSSMRPALFWSFFFMYFIGTAAMFGIHAHAIKWLLSRGRRSDVAKSEGAE